MTEIRELQPTSFAEFEAIPKQEGWNYELIDGMVMMSPRPSVAHQSICGNLYVELRSILRGKGCRPMQEIDLVLDGNTFIPDLLVDCTDLSDKKRCEVPPIIAIEILSPATASIDYFVKRHKYELLGVQEYWIVSPEEKCVMVISFTSGKQERYCSGQVESVVLPDIKIDLDKIFDLSY